MGYAPKPEPEGHVDPRIAALEADGYVVIHRPVYERMAADHETTRALLVAAGADAADSRAAERAVRDRLTELAVRATDFGMLASEVLAIAQPEPNRDPGS